MAHFFYAAAVVGNPNVPFAVLHYFVHVVVGDSVALVVVGQHSVPKDCDSAVARVPVVSVGILQDGIHRRSDRVVVAHVKDCLFRVLQANDIMRRHAKPKRPALVLRNFVHGRVLDFFDSVKAADNVVFVNKKLVGDCRGNPNAVGGVAKKL